jgi:hypothetical protein
MTEAGIETNETTGLHVGLSFNEAEKIHTLNMAKLSCILDESEILDKFGRKNNRYCKPTLPQIRKSMLRKIEQDLRQNGVPRVPTSVEELSRYAGQLDKYHFVNYSKVPRGYLEFRGMGGTNYHGRFDEIKECVLHFVECMDIASDPNKTNRRLEGKMKTILRAGKKKALVGLDETIARAQAERDAMTAQYDQRLTQLTQVQQRLNAINY